jgi:hypothetical protein
MSGKYAASALALCVLAASFFFSLDTFPNLPLCPSRALFDVPCPGCGLTRAFLAIAHLHFSEAWALHPFSFFLFAGTVVCVFLPWLPEPNSRAVAVCGIVFVVAVWIWGLARATGWIDGSAAALRSPGDVAGSLEGSLAAFARAACGGDHRS